MKKMRDWETSMAVSRLTLCDLNVILGKGIFFSEISMWSVDTMIQESDLLGSYITKVTKQGKVMSCLVAHFPTWPVLLSTATLSLFREALCVINYSYPCNLLCLLFFFLLFRTEFLKPNVIYLTDYYKP